MLLPRVQPLRKGGSGRLWIRSFGDRAHYHNPVSTGGEHLIQPLRGLDTADGEPGTA